jgi:hypothetical protein
MTLVCLSCGARWKILPGSRGDRFDLCPNCRPSLPASVAEAAPVAEPMPGAGRPVELGSERDAYDD